MENETLATELLHELKASAKRWFIIAIIELVIICGITGAFLWYISLPVDYSEWSVEQESTDRSFNNIGGYISGIETEGDVPEISPGD